MLVVTGTALVLVTWAAGVAVAVTAGLLPALATSHRIGRRTRARAPEPLPAALLLRRALWWGLLVVTVFAYLANLAWPLASAQTAVAGLLVLAGLGVPGWLVLRRERVAVRRPHGRQGEGHGRLARISAGLLVLALAVAACYLAVAALGPVTNYDSGLYHLGAIRYTADFATIPGLANLYFPFGYGNAEFPLAALLGNGPWGTDGFRLLNGLVVVLALADLALRLRGASRGRRATPGLFVLLAGLVVALVPLLALSDYWVTSPTQDSFVFVLTVVAAGYLADAAWDGRTWLADGAVVVALSVALVLLRPTMVAFGFGVVVVLAVLARRRRATLRAQGPGWVLGTVMTAGLLAGLAATARDVLLSGWLQYPLSVFAFDVPWRADDPVNDRLATLGYHRDPADLWNAARGWGWVGPWLVERVHQWETYLLAGLAVVALVLAHVADRALRADRATGATRRPRWRAMLLAMLPSAVATFVWFAFSPPSYRFAWGPLFTLATIPIGWSLFLLSTRGRASRRPDAARVATIGQRIAPATWRSLTALAVAVPVLLVAGYSALARLDVAAMTAEREWRLGTSGLGLSVPYAVVPVDEVPVIEAPVEPGFVLLVPKESEQCWWSYPLCTPQWNPTVRMRGDGIQDGFAH